MTSLGPRIRMRALKPAEIPSNPAFAAQQTTGTPPPELHDFITTTLQEGLDFVTGYWPKSFKVKSAAKPSPPSNAPVELFSREIPATELPSGGSGGAAKATGTEVWFARTSVHENAAKTGSASWEEFDAGLRANHSQHEKDYTPNVYDAHEVCDWDAALGEGGAVVGEWKDVRMYVVEMVHQIPAPLDDRVFPELVVTAKKEQALLVVQIPIDLKGVDAAKYNGDAKKTTGMYCSVEYGEVVDGGAKVKWQMATASDAKGNVPMFVQKMGVPGAVVKDVGLFIGWCDQQRKGKA